MARIQYIPNRVIDRNGISDGAELFVYQAGTTTKVPLFSDEELTDPILNPVVTVVGAEVPVFYTSYTDDIRLRIIDRRGNVAMDEDPYFAPITNVELQPIKDFVTDLGGPNGSQKVGFLQAGVYAEPRDLEGKNREIVSLLDYYQPTDTDMTDAFKGAFDYAKSLVIPDTPSDGYGYVKKGGVDVRMPAGVFPIHETIEFYLNVGLKGAGMNSSIIKGLHDAPILRNDPTTTGPGTYNREGSALRDFGILGDPTKPNQVGLALLRLINSPIDNVAVNKCGGDGVLMRECSCNVITNLRVAENVGKGLRMRRGLELFWDSPENDLPSNGNVFVNFRSIANGDYGLSIEDLCNGIVFEDPYLEYNNATAGGNFGYQASITTASYAPIIFNRLWSEGSSLKAHVRVNASGAEVVLNNWRHFASGELVDRALIVEAGAVIVNTPWGAEIPYRLINGSRAPYRVANGAATIDVFDHRGAAISGYGIVEKMDGSRVGLFGTLAQRSRDTLYGNQRVYADSGAVSAMEFFRDDDLVNSWLRMDPFRRRLTFTDTGLQRTGARELSLIAEDGGASFLNHGSSWNDSHLKLGNYHLWVDSTGDLRIKNSFPTGDTDGTVVGTQS